MSMKKIVLLGMLFLVLLIPVKADTTDVKEDRLLAYEKGAELRFMQLEEALYRNYMQAAEAIRRVQAQNPDADVEEAREKSYEIRMLLNEVSNTDVTEYSRDELVSLFVRYRTLTNELSREFRAIISELLSEEVRAEIRAERPQSEDAQRIRERVSAVAVDFNRERVRAIVGEDVEAEIRTRAQAAEVVRQRQAQVSEEDRRLIAQRQAQIAEQNRVERERVAQRALVERELIASQRAEILTEIRQREAQRPQATRPQNTATTSNQQRPATTPGR